MYKINAFTVSKHPEALDRERHRFGKIIILLASVAFVSSLDLSKTGQAKQSLWGVDPNTMSCDPQGLISLLLPHTTDCSKFYMCAHGEEVEFTCPSPLIFDWPLQTCNWEFASECILRTPEESTEESSEDSIESGQGSGEGSGWGPGDEFEFPGLPIHRPHNIDVAAALRTSGHQNSDQAVSEINCLEPQLSSRLAAYRGDCQRYWRCNNGAAEAAFCADGLYFNPRTSMCDYEANVPCARDAQIHEEIGEEFILN